ncbi:MAG: protein translocase subunit SecF, partial [Actinobacteria bacterium]|nr:protein translocase subunit SecF [Actinomycetota bacterium]
MFKLREYNFMGRRRMWYILSIVIILAGVAGYFIRGGFDLGIDFLGGSLTELEFSRDVEVEEIREVLEESGYPNAVIQRTGPDRFIIRTTPIEADEKESIIKSFNEKIGVNGAPIQDRNVLPGFGRQIANYALIAIAISIVGILIYVWIRFEFRFGICAIAALAHDVLITLGLYVILNREINTSTIAAILTILGYSLNDTIVVFDRIRENKLQAKSIGYSEMVNRSVNATLSRSINTS